MIKILFIITRIEKSGPNRVLQNMIYGINKKKYKVTVLSLFNVDNDYKKIPGIDYLCLNLKSNIDALIKAKKLVNKIENEIKPDIVHSHGIMPDYYNTLFKNAYKINTLHCNIFEDYKYAHNHIKALLMIKFHLFSLKRIDTVVCCSKSVFNGMKKNISHNGTYIDNGIINCNVHNNSSIRKELNIDNDDLIFIYIGALSKRKNVTSFVNLFLPRMKKNEHLIILGDGEYKNNIIDACKDNNNVHILGFQSNVEDYLEESDVYVSASLSEGLSISVIEALSNGLMLLLSDIESHKEFFNKDNTYIGEVFNEKTFDKKLNIIRNHFLSKNKDLIKKYKEKFFSDKSMMKEYEKLYEKR